MKKLQYIITSIILMVCSSKMYAQPQPCAPLIIMQTKSFDQCDYNPWVLVFEDNFDGNTLDLSKWNPITGVPRDFDFTLQKAWHLPENLVVNNGSLKIITKKLTTPYTGTWVIDWSTNPPTTKTSTFNYTTGELWTKSTFSYGKFEARVKIPKGKGFFPAFWTFGGNPWNEIDIFEFHNEKTNDNYDASKLSKVHIMTSHYDYDNDGNTNLCMTNYSGVDFSQDFHTFAVIWEKDKIQWLVDGVVKRTDFRYYTILSQPTGCSITAGQYILNQIYPKDPMAIIFNLAIQSGSDSPDNSTLFPSQMEVDWVRYYQRKSCQNVNITNANQYPLDNQIFNVIAGTNVNINCNYTVQSGQQLDVIAQNSIKLNAGFKTETGSTFRAKVDPTCCSTLKSANVVEDTLIWEDTMQTKEFETEVIIENNSGITVFPNPSDGNFTIDFGSVDYTNFNVALTNMEGKLILSIETLHTPTTEITLKDTPNGVYMLYLFNKLEQSVITHKIIKQ